MTDTTEAPARRTKRRYAHELYPHGEEFETRPLEVEVPYLYARMVGMEVSGTSWFDMREGDANLLALERMNLFISSRHVAMLADALHQGMSGEEAWAWADRGLWDYDGELAYQRAIHYGVPVDQIKPYPCGPEPDHHDHYDEPDAHGWRTVHRIEGKESECPDCTEEVPA